MIDEHKLRDLIKDCVREVVRSELSPKPDGDTGSSYLSVAEAAELTGLSEKTLRRAINSRELAAARRGRAVRIARADLLAWMRSTPAVPGTVVAISDAVKRLRTS